MRRAPERRGAGKIALLPALTLAVSVAACGLGGSSRSASGHAPDRVAAAAVSPPTPSAVDRGDPATLLAAVEIAIGALERVRPPAGVARPATGDAAERAANLDGLRELRRILQGRAGTRPDSGSTGDAALEVDGVVARRFGVASAAEVLVTGYHEPTLAARRSPDARFRYPIHARPSSEVSATRGEIEAGALAGRGLEIFWVDDPIELFFLHVQGSGRLDLGDGRTARVGFAGTNGRAYVSIGSVLVGRGVFSPSEATAPAIKAWLRAHPGETRGVLERNERYVFFRELPAAPPEQGPPGAMGVPLVPERSVAVDPEVTPLGSVGRLSTPLPDGRSLDILVVAMDRGAAIRGPGRIDLFLGPGRTAEDLAGLLRSSGRVEWLRLRPE